MSNSRMTWRNVWLVTFRELRDQMRDRRTLFVIFILPVLIYPLLGMFYFQMMQARGEKPSRVLLFGADFLPQEADMPALLGEDGNRFAKQLFDPEQGVSLLHVTQQDDVPDSFDQAKEAAVEAIRANKTDVALVIAPGFADRLSEVHQQVAETHDLEKPPLTKVAIIHSTANEKSQIANDRLTNVVRKWRNKLGHRNLTAGGVPLWAVQPFDVVVEDTVVDTHFRGAALWSKMLPILLVVWALTGAFYPAIDLCAGEKERGTLETLLCSPAERSEIVLGKLLTVMAFSMATSILNIISVTATGTLLVSRAMDLGAPPPMAAVWLFVALIPISALFGAICLVMAAFARSTKEGQYYLMPLLLVTLVLVLMPMMPGTEISLGQSLIPVTGLVLLLGSLLEGAYMDAVRFLPPVALVTLACCYAAIRVAVDLFTSEHVLFRAGERFDLKAWLVHLVRDRRPTPTFGMAIVAGFAILMVKFFANFVVNWMPETSAAMLTFMAVYLVAVIGIPTLLFTLLFTSDRVSTLRLRMPSQPLALFGAFALAIVWKPLHHWMTAGVIYVYPSSEQMTSAAERMADTAMSAPIGWVLFVMALMPAVLEELAFRGYIMTGLLDSGRKWRAIVISAIFFGLSHAILQQQILATITGVLIAYIVIQCGSIWAGVIFHAAHNGLVTLVAKFSHGVPTDEIPTAITVMHHWSMGIVSAVLTIAVIVWFKRLTDRHA